jgi:hypothetical protein
MMTGFHNAILRVASQLCLPPPSLPAALLNTSEMLHRLLGSAPQVQWMEMPGSKIRFTSILHMAFELLTLKLAYQWLALWRVAEETDARGRINAPGRAKAS